MMGGMSFGLIIESMVAILLCLTIGYCIVLNNRLKRLHADRSTLRDMIDDLIKATNMANGAIKQLHEVATEADLTLNSRLEEAEKFGVQLANHVTSGQAVLERIEKITQTARGSKADVLSPAVEQAEPASRSSRASRVLEQLDMHARAKEAAA